MRRLLLPLVVLLALVASACGGSEPTAEQVSPDAAPRLRPSQTNEARLLTRAATLILRR